MFGETVDIINCFSNTSVFCNHTLNLPLPVLFLKKKANGLYPGEHFQDVWNYYPWTLYVIIIPKMCTYHLGWWDLLIVLTDNSLHMYYDVQWDIKY